MTTEELSSPIGIGSASTNTIREQMLQSLQTSKEYRHGFVEEAIRTRIAAQIKTIREQQGWDPKKCAEEIGTKVRRRSRPSSALQKHSMLALTSVSVLFLNF